MKNALDASFDCGNKKKCFHHTMEGRVHESSFWMKVFIHKRFIAFINVIYFLLMMKQTVLLLIIHFC